MRKFSVTRTRQQNGVIEKRNRTLIEASMTMLDDSKLPTTFWAEAVNIACYVQNRVLVVKLHNKTPYEHFHGRTPTLSFTRPFGCPVTILNTKDYLGKFDGKADEGFFFGYFLNSKAFRVFKYRTRIVEENFYIRFSKSTPNVVGSGPDWLFDIDALTRTMNYEPIVASTQSNGLIDLKSSQDDGFKYSSNDGKKVDEDPSKGSECKDQEKQDNVNITNNVNTVSLIVNAAGFEDLNFPDRVYKVEKALYGLHQASRAWYETLSTYMLDNGFQKGEIDKTLFIKRHKGELTFFLGLPVKQKIEGIFISQDKYVAKISKKFGFIEVKNASTPMETQKPLLKDED
nr:ribonuclease H-like domain-containing protein [Tanacetum cinerariifolium]